MANQDTKYELNATKTNDYLRTQDVRTDVWSNKHEKGYNSRKKQTFREIGLYACSEHVPQKYQK